MRIELNYSTPSYCSLENCWMWAEGGGRGGEGVGGVGNQLLHTLEIGSQKTYLVFVPCNRDSKCLKKRLKKQKGKRDKYTNTKSGEFIGFLSVIDKASIQNYQYR